MQDQLTDEENENYCKFLNLNQANFTDCCDYPKFQIWEWHWNEGVAKCDAEGLSGLYGTCCRYTFTYNKLNLIALNVNEDDDLVPSFAYSFGYFHNFMLSVGNDSQWEPVFYESIQKCDEQFARSVKGYFCDVIPLSLWAISDCCIRENYLKCPAWNPNGLQKCKYTYEYVLKCPLTGNTLQYI